MCNPEDRPQTVKTRVPRERLSIAIMLFLLAGICVALVVTRPVLMVPYKDAESGDTDPIQVLPVALRVVIAVLGGLSFVGVPLLLWRRRRFKSRWGPGKSAWFAHGMASWLLWPPILFYRERGTPELPWSSVCWFWGTPLMGVYVTLSLLAGGWLGRRSLRRAKRSWPEQFGILLAGLWASTGLYLLYLLYKIDIFAKR